MPKLPFPRRLRLPHLPRLLRLPIRALTFARLLRGGRVGDGGRLPRYLGVFVLSAGAIWGAIGGYLATAPLRYTSDLSLILPGTGATASVNLDRIGQASTSANSPYTNSSISPTETYKRLLGATRILDTAAAAMHMQTRDFGKPRIELVDQTGLMHIKLTGNSPEDARDRARALLDAFFAEVDALRSDEAEVRATGSGASIDEYRKSVQSTRERIAELQHESGLLSSDQFDALITETERMAETLRTQAAELAGKGRTVTALEASLGTTPDLAAAALKLHADSEFGALAGALAEATAALTNAQASFGPGHPRVQAAAAAKRTARKALERRAAALTGLPGEALARLDLSDVGRRAPLLSQLVTLAAERTGLMRRQEALQRQYDEATARRDRLLGPATRLKDLQRDFAVAEAVFASAIARGQTSRADRFASYPLVQVLEDPSLPERPSSPRRKLAIAAGGAATIFLLIGLGMGWLRRPLIDRLLAGSEAPPPRFMAAAE
ncbi:GumC domain-containing protein [Acidimangrovimonas sediminis]|uniref:hypothetical protein n=1 Tax=Acidimangrovimonas sediminis TaxID=2056283 RepID=UPI000C80F607|nr:hypothetical protein [Acidimangrovimonas sediminis]